MEPRNSVTYFVLWGLYTESKGAESPFVLFLFFYILTMVGNLLIFVTITVSKTLNSPMYFFCLFIIYRSNLSLFYYPEIDFIFVPWEKHHILWLLHNPAIYRTFFFWWSEISILLVMDYDCYVAICKNLHYLVIMRQRVCVVLLIVPCFGGFLHSFIQLSTVYGLPFCGPNVTDHFTCDMYPHWNLSVLTPVISVSVLANGGLMGIILFLLLLVSYGVIMHSLKNLSQGREAESPLDLWFPHYCGCLLLFSCIFMYERPAKTFPIDKSMSRCFIQS